MSRNKDLRKFRRAIIRIATQYVPTESRERFRIREFGAADTSSSDGFRRFIVYSDQRVEELRQRYNNEDVYVSVFMYSTEDFENALLSGDYYVDVDSKSDPNLALEGARMVVEALRNLGIQDDQIKVWWSGAKGFHIEVAGQLFGATPHRHLNRVWRTLTQMIDQHLFEKYGNRVSVIDWQIYDRRRLWRVPNSVNSKTGLYKIPLKVTELFSLSVDEIRELAKQLRNLPEPPMPKPQDNLVTLFRTLVERIEAEPLRFAATLERKLEREPYVGEDPPSIKYLLKLRMKEGQGRNNVAIILYSYYSNFKGLPSQEARRIVEDWNANNLEPLSEKELTTLIKSSAEHGYVYGCSTLEQYYCNRWECPLFPAGPGSLPPDLTQKAKQLQRDPDLLQRFNEVTDRWVVRDYAIRRLCLRAYASAFSDDPINLSLLGRDSIGKTYVAIAVAKLLPPQYAWFLGALSPTGLVNDYGTWDSVTRSFTVDMNQKIMLFLEPPAKETLDRLKPILSHDKTEITFKITQKTKGGQLRTVTTHVKGWPVVLMCAAKTGYASEYSTRWLTSTPEISTQKTRDAMIKAAEIAENPEFFKGDQDVQLWRACLTLLAQLAPIKVKIPYAKILAEHFIARGPETMRIFKLFMRLIKANAILHVAQRQTDQEGYVLASAEDLWQVLEDFRTIAAPSFLGISGDALMLGEALAGKEGLRFEDIARKASEIFGSEIAEATLRDLYIKRLVEVGLLREYEDPTDRRRKLYDPMPRLRFPDVRVFDDEELVRQEVGRVSIGQT